MAQSVRKLLSSMIVLTPLAVALSMAALPATAEAATKFETTAEYAYLVDHETGAVLFEKNPHEQMAPSSMTKLMTVYLLFERLANGTVSLDDSFPVSEKAWRMGGSKMFVEVGDRVRVEDLIRGIVVQSGNDACIVVAEALAGSEEAFAEQMNAKARELGMTDSHFVNASGWPNPDHYVSAADLAKLAGHIIDEFPQYYHYFAETEFTYAGIKQGNRNPLLYKNMGVDGLKTGHTEAAGYGLVASVPRDDRRLILVINGLDSTRARSVEGERLLSYGLRDFDNYRFFRSGEVVDHAEVWLGDSALVPLVAADDIVMTLPRDARRDMTAKVVYEGPVPAPIQAGTQIADLVIEAPGMQPARVPLLAGADVAPLSRIGRIGAAISYLVWGPATQ